ncbi:hypothetical protein D6D29_08891, partial [Aureobasidium pullulans]
GGGPGIFIPGLVSLRSSWDSFCIWSFSSAIFPIKVASFITTKSKTHRYSSTVLPQVDHRQTITQILVNMTPAHPQAASRPRLILRSDSFTHEDLSAAFAASASQPRTKDLKIRIAQKDETPAPPPSPTEAFSSHRP